jgi:hypothetical protein
MDEDQPGLPGRDPGERRREESQLLLSPDKWLT